MTAVTAAMRWAVRMTPAAATSSPAVTEPASTLSTSVTGRTTVWMVRTRQTACASRLSPPALLSSTCASRESASIPIRCATDRRTVRMTVMKKAAVRGKQTQETAGHF